jgi:DNA-binding NtrC family response regulator
VPNFTQTQVDAMRNYAWPGNIRELKNVIERAVILSQGDTLQMDLSDNTGRSEEVLLVPGVRSVERGFLTEKELRLQQRENMRLALEYAGWRISGAGGAAELLGLKPTTLTDRMRSYGLAKPAEVTRKRAPS